MKRTKNWVTDHREPVCDFCLRPGPRWSFDGPFPDAGLHVLGDRTVLIEDNGVWAACPECADLVDRIRADLASLRAYAERISEPDYTVEDAVDQVLQTLASFHALVDRAVEGWRLSLDRDLDDAALNRLVAEHRSSVSRLYRRAIPSLGIRRAPSQTELSSDGSVEEEDQWPVLN